MKKDRRSFLKKAAFASAVAATSAIAATATSKSDVYSSNGVVVGHSNKKEILYKKTEAWSDYYRSAM